MSTEAVPLVEEEPPLTRTQRAVAKVCQCLLIFLCGAPIALFPVALAYKALVYFLS